MWTDAEKEFYHNKMSISAIQNRKTISKEEYTRRSIQANQTRKRNGTYVISSAEQRVYKALLNKYPSDDVITQYCDERYPYKCDFYIKSKDLFIEINLHPSHGEHPFDVSSETDLLLKQRLELDGTKWSNMILYTWAGLDVKKQAIAKENNLNYKAIYASDFDNFIKELETSV